MTNRKRFILLGVILALVAVGASGIPLWLLYTTGLETEQELLVAMVKNQARLIEAVGRFDAVYSIEDNPEGPQAATRSQVLDAHNNAYFLGQTGEFILGLQQGSDITLFLAKADKDERRILHFSRDSVLIEPMRRALAGQSGTLIGPDHDGNLVLAAYEPLEGLDYALVAKIDMDEFRRPFIRSALLSAAGVLAVSLGGMLLLLWVGRMLDAAQTLVLKHERMATLGRLAASLGHELRNPLSIIKNSAFILNATPHQPGSREEKSLTRIRNAVERCLMIIEDMLEFTRSRDPVTQLIPFDVWLREVLAEQPLQPQIRLETHLQTKDTMTRIDPERFRQVIINLVTNACEAMLQVDAKPKTPWRLQVETRAEKDRLILSIKDQGSGVPEGIKKEG